MILARHADSMLWAGRYLERADTIARCVSVETNAVMHRPPTEARLAARRLVQALGLQDEFVAARVSTGPYAVMDFLVSDDSHPGSVASAVQAVRENLRIVRDRIPVELWEEANSLYILMQSAKAVSAGTREQTGGEVSRMSVITARRGCRSLSGVMTESMMRDEGYAFLEVGRLLERAILTVELLKSGLGTGSDVFDGNRLLAFTHSLQAARREIGHSPSWDAAARFLLQHETLPRSVLWCLGRVERRLDDLAAAAGAVATPRRRAGALRAHLEYGELDAALAHEPEVELSGLGTALATLAADVHASTVAGSGLAQVHSQFVRPGHGVPNSPTQQDPKPRDPKPQDDRS